MQPTQIIQVVSIIGGAIITATAGYYTAMQQRRQGQISELLTALQTDNRDLREENRKLREDLESERNRHTQRRGTTHDTEH